MAVFTDVGFDEAAELVSRLGLGALKSLRPIASGIENTNYFASAERGEYVLTVFERLSFEQLPFYLHLMKHLAQRGLRSEPAVQRSVVEDDNARIEELRVRGAVRSTVVKPKGAITKEYEVIPADAGRDISAGPNSAKGSAGQRVWRVLSF